MAAVHDQECPLCGGTPDEKIEAGFAKRVRARDAITDLAQTGLREFGGGLA